ncbi:rhomboid family intramembrane serine protease [Vaginella massiliensis]|uniref:rhomboid family intramembrane serine protease n=1 Tax=Vaginella massiliensis TaxID=1816680 RepID=UPI00083994F0|nr:rhomboid family intramembrane serine protease [Vaginella massiliensis]
MIKGILDDLKLRYRTGNIATKLIYYNVVCFFSFLIIGFLLQQFMPTTSMDRWFALSYDYQQVFTKPWTIFSYAFMHGDLLHLLFNMLLLYYAGVMFLRYFRDQDFVTFFVIGILSGAIFFVVFSSSFDRSANFLVGSSAAIFAVFFALVSYNPRIPVRLLFFPKSFPLYYVALFLVGLDVFQLFAGKNPGGSLSHLGAALAGYLYMKQFEKGNDFVGKAIRAIENFFRRDKKSTFKTSKSKPFSRTHVPKDDYEYNSMKVEKQKKINSILDKISRSGYESLSKEEKDFLFREGRS